jgi:hypothetical protein
MSYNRGLDRDRAREKLQSSDVLVVLAPEAAMLLFHVPLNLARSSAAQSTDSGCPSSTSNRQSSIRSDRSGSLR